MEITEQKYQALKAKYGGDEGAIVALKEMEQSLGEKVTVVNEAGEEVVHEVDIKGYKPDMSAISETVASARAWTAAGSATSFRAIGGTTARTICGAA